jgi:nitrate reductase NapD
MRLPGAPRARLPPEVVVPVLSYLAHAAPDRVTTLEATLAAIPGCEVYASERRDVLVLITDTPDDAASDALHERLCAIEDLTALVLVSAFTDEA